MLTPASSSGTTTEVGRIGRDQEADYTRCKSWTMAEAERWPAPNLSYEPED